MLDETSASAEVRDGLPPARTDRQAPARARAEPKAPAKAARQARSRSSPPAARSPARGRQRGYGYKSGSFKVEDLIKAVPKLDKLAKLSGEQVANIGSQDMNDEVWLKLAKRVNELLQRRTTSTASSITHGTDTMEETAYFLNLVVKSDKPVVLVGSMRPATAISADGPAQPLQRRGDGAASPDARGRGVLVVINDEIHSARNVDQDQHHQRRDVREPEPRPGRLREQRQDHWFERMDKKHTSQLEFSRRRPARSCRASTSSTRTRTWTQRSIQRGASKTAPRASSSPASATAT